MKFKVGDKVTRMNCDRQEVCRGSSYIDYFELVEEKTKLKIGDHVKRSNGTNGTDFEENDTGIITKISNYYAAVKLDKNKSIINPGNDINNLELVKEDKHKFKVGDHVRRINSSLNIMDGDVELEFKVGETGIIEKISKISSGSLYITATIRLDKDPTKINKFNHIDNLELVDDKIYGQTSIKGTMTICSTPMGKSIFDEMFEQDNKEDPKMELKDIKKTNLAEAKKQFDKEQANDEVVQAKIQLSQAIDNIDRIDREIKRLTEAKQPHLDVIKQFK